MAGCCIYPAEGNLKEECNMTSLSQLRSSILEHLHRTLFTGAMVVAMTLHAAVSSPATAAASAADRLTRLSTA